MMCLGGREKSHSFLPNHPSRTWIPHTLQACRVPSYWDERDQFWERSRAPAKQIATCRTELSVGHSRAASSTGMACARLPPTRQDGMGL